MLPRMPRVAPALVALLLVGAACTSDEPRLTPSSRGAEPFPRGARGYDEADGGRIGRPEPIEEIRGRQHWFYTQRSAPARRVPEGARLAALDAANALPGADLSIGARTGGATTLAAGAGPQWRSLGPRPIDSSDETYNDPVGGTPPLGWHDVSGRLTSVAVHPRDASVAYVGAADGGVWKTTTSGRSWRPIGDHLDSLAIGAIAIAPKRPRVVYVGTGEASTNADAYWGVGIYRTRDGGQTFAKLGGGVFNRATVFQIAVRSFGRQLLVATNRGLYRSNDRGRTWTRVLAPGGEDEFGNFVTDVVLLPNKQVLAAVGWRGGHAANGLYLSNDKGKTFARITPAGFAPQPNVGRVSLAADRGAPGLLYAVVQDAVLFNTPGSPTVLNGVYKTTTGPNGPWSQVATSATFASDENSAMNPLKIGPGFQPGVQAWYDQYVVIDPNDPDHVVVGLEEVYDTDDGGASWDTIARYWNWCLSNAPPNCNLDPDQHPTPHPDQHAAAFGVDGGASKLYIANDGGAWTQVGPDWTNDEWRNRNATLSVTQPYYATASAGPDFTVYAGTQDNGNVKYTGGQRWVEVYGGDGGDVAVEPDEPDHTYEEYVFLTMSKSSDGGRTWTDISPSDSNPRFIAPFDLDPTDDQHLVAVGQEVWESHQGIATESSDWQESYDLGSPRQGTALGVDGATIYVGWCGPCNPTTLDSDAGFASGLVSNVGGTWHEVAGDLPNRYVTSVTIDPNDDEHVFVTLSGFSRRWIPDAGHGHVFESTDGGTTFTDVSRNLPDAPANDSVLDGDRLIVGTDVGVFRQRADGSWKVLGSGMPAVSTLDLFMVPNTDTVLAATHGRGMWTLDLP
ncbi:MAG TPA: hypothetical protein VHJ34_00330 [Actinomycetota bacterium]|nr:hypothetical protein [Actinomycetota bacterium]